jgi:exosome complex RNA-binding protein Csl4
MVLAWVALPLDAMSQSQGEETKTIIGDLLDVDRDFYIVRGPLGEIQIEATYKSEITEEFGYGDRIKALVHKNLKAIRIERAGPDDVNGIVINQAEEGLKTEERKNFQEGPGKKSAIPQPKKPKTKTIIADILMVDGDFHVVRSEYGEIRIEVTPKTKMSEEFKFGDKIKAEVDMIDKAISIERAPSDASAKKEKPKPEKIEEITIPNERIVEGSILMIDGDFYVMRGERGEIRVERTPDTKVTEEFKFGDRIRATVLKNDKALKIERAP